MERLTNIEKELLVALKALVEVMPQIYVHFPYQREAVKNAYALIDKIETLTHETPAHPPPQKTKTPILIQTQTNVPQGAIACQVGK